jgi:hypothetical protein
VLLAEAEGVVLDQLRGVAFPVHILGQATHRCDDTKGDASLVFVEAQRDVRWSSVGEMTSALRLAFGSEAEGWRFLMTGECSVIHTALAVWLETLLTVCDVVYQERRVRKVELAHVYVAKSYERRIFAYCESAKQMTDDPRSWPPERWCDNNSPHHTVVRLTLDLFGGTCCLLDVDMTAAQYQITARTHAVPSRFEYATPLPIVLSSSSGAALPFAMAPYCDAKRTVLQAPIATLCSYTDISPATFEGSLCMLLPLMEQHKLTLAPAILEAIAASCVTQGSDDSSHSDISG